MGEWVDGWFSAGVPSLEDTVLDMCLCQHGPPSASQVLLTINHQLLKSINQSINQPAAASSSRCPPSVAAKASGINNSRSGMHTHTHKYPHPTHTWFSLSSWCSNHSSVEVNVWVNDGAGSSLSGTGTGTGGQPAQHTCIHIIPTSNQLVSSATTAHTLVRNAWRRRPRAVSRCRCRRLMMRCRCSRSSGVRPRGRWWVSWPCSRLGRRAGGHCGDIVCLPQPGHLVHTFTCWWVHCLQHGGADVNHGRHLLTPLASCWRAGKRSTRVTRAVAGWPTARLATTK